MINEAQTKGLSSDKKHPIFPLFFFLLLLLTTHSSFALWTHEECLSFLFGCFALLTPREKDLMTTWVTFSPS